MDLNKFNPFSKNNNQSKSQHTSSNNSNSSNNSKFNLNKLNPFSNNKKNPQSQPTQQTGQTEADKTSANNSDNSSSSFGNSNSNNDSELGENNNNIESQIHNMDTKDSFHLSDLNPFSSKKKKQQSQQNKNPFGKEIIGSGGTTPFSHKKSKMGRMKLTSSIGSFFRIMFGIHPHHEDKSKILANADPEQLQEHKDMEEYRNGLHFPADLLTSHEAMEYYRMGTPYKEIHTTAWMRLGGSLLIGILPIFVFMVMKKPLILLAIPIVMLLFWIIVGLGIKSSYKGFSIHQQFMFDILMSILSPYLYQMNKANANSASGQSSVSMNAILGHVAHRIQDRRTKHSVSTLGIDIRHHPHSFAPYERFARTFSTSPMAYMFMSSVYHMANGSTDVSAIRYLNRSSMDDLLKQIQKIKVNKLKRFFTPPIVMFIDWFVIVLGYFILYVFDMLKSNLSNMGSM